MLAGDLAEDVAEVCRQRQVAALVQLIAPQPGPLPVNLATTNVVAENKHRVSVTMVSAATAVFPGGAAELRHRQNHNIVHALPEVSVERGDGVAKLLQQIAKLATAVSFVEVGIPVQARRVGESY